MVRRPLSPEPFLRALEPAGKRCDGYQGSSGYWLDARWDLLVASPGPGDDLARTKAPLARLLHSPEQWLFVG